MQGGAPRVLSSFLPKRKKRISNLNWVHGFHKALEVVLDFAYDFVLCIFAGGAPRVLSKYPPKTKKANPIGIGYMDFIRCWRLFRDSVYEIVP